MIWLLAASALASTWRLDMVSASEAKVPVFGWQNSETVSLVLVHLDDDGSWRHEVCSARIDDHSALVRTELRPEFIAHIPHGRSRAVIDGDAITVDLGLEAIGWDPKVATEMPRTVDAPGVIDHEGDGRPGATVWVFVSLFGTGSMEVVQQSQAILSGQRDGDGWKGGVRVTVLDQAVLGADKRVLRDTPEIRAVDERSWFTLTPTTAATCPALVATTEG